METTNPTPENPEPTKDQIIAGLENQLAILTEAHRLLLEENEAIKLEAYTDSLTGLSRRGVFERELAHNLSIIEAGRNQTRTGVEEHRHNLVEISVLSLVIFDIDKFKSINDTFGHSAGDIVLKAVAEIIKRYTRGQDIECRWGGEEMGLAMIGADLEVAKTKADFIRQKISQLEFKFSPINEPNKILDLKITISAGVASSDQFNDSASLFKAADDALYQSKEGGRNRVTAY